MAFEKIRAMVSQVASGFSAPQPSSRYLQGFPETDHYASFPMPSLRDASSDVRAAWRGAATRAVDAMHNNGWISGTTDAMVSLMIGDGLTPNLQPDMSMFGWNDDQTAAWARRMEGRFKDYAENKYAVDAGGRYTLGQIQAAYVRQWFGTGDILAEYPTIFREGSEWGSKIRLLPSHWLSQKTMPSKNLNSGVYLDGHGAPVGYNFRVPQQNGIIQEVDKAARDGFGRAIIDHTFDGSVGSVRGITPWAPVLRVLKNYDQLTDATLTSEMIKAIYAATIESDYPTSEVLDALQSEDEAEFAQEKASRFDSFMGNKVGWHKNVDIDLGRHGKIAHLMMGEKLKFNTPNSAANAYEQMANFLLREIARCGGALLSDVTGDYRGEGYSSIRMGIAKQWPLLLYRRKHLATPPSKVVLENFIEEEVDSGRAEIPGGMEAFLANKSAICRAKWRGPAKPVADEVKAARTHREYRDMGVISDQDIANDLGTDIDSVYEQRAKEKAARERREIHGGVTNGGTDMDMMMEMEDVVENGSANQ